MAIVKSRDMWIQDIQSVFDKLQFPVHSVGLYGSVARNQHTHESDIDIVVIVKKPYKKDYSIFHRTIEKLLNIKVDLLVMKPDSLINVIEEEDCFMGNVLSDIINVLGSAKDDIKTAIVIVQHLHQTKKQ